jgi:DNA-binding transcriptional LysR family regulator
LPHPTTAAYAGAVPELRHLRYFVAVAEELNFSRAARRLRMAQPPLSVAIRQLEQEIGTSLFHRTSREVKLTEAGTVLLDHARRTIAEAEGPSPRRGAPAQVSSVCSASVTAGPSGSRRFRRSDRSRDAFIPTSSS